MAERFYNSPSADDYPDFDYDYYLNGNPPTQQPSNGRQPVTFTVGDSGQNYGQQRSEELRERDKRKARASQGGSGKRPDKLSEIQAAGRYAINLVEVFRYRPSHGWNQFTSGWRPDREHALISLLREASEAEEFRRGASVHAIERLMRSELADTAQWDASPDLAGLPYGHVIDLVTGKQRKVTVSDRITRQLGTLPSTDSKPERWLQFLSEVLPEGGAQWIQRWCGYCLTGHTREHKFLFAYGRGGNGKGVFAHVLAAALGTYRRGVPSDALTGRTPMHRQWLARLDGARLAMVSEIGAGYWRSEMLKELVAGDEMTANFMRQNSFDFRPVAKLVIQGNNKPRLQRADYAFARRLVLMPFSRRFDASTADPELADYLVKRELPGIMQWMVEGAAQWYREGLGNPPAAAADAAEQYLSDEDDLGDWIRENFEFRDDYAVSNAAIKERISDTGCRHSLATVKAELVDEHRCIAPPKGFRLTGQTKTVRGIKFARLTELAR